MINFKKLKEPYLIAEIGINHNGDIQIAKKLIDAAFACGWDCVKFQKRNPDIAVPEAQKKLPKETPWGKMTYLDYKKKLEFGKEEYDYIDKYCREKPIHWTASVWDLPSLEFLLNYKVPFIKLPSAKITDRQLLIEAARSGKPLLVPTGMSSIKEIDKAVRLLEKYASQYMLMHCNSAYPAPYNELNLQCIQTLAQRYGCPIGYSGHEYGVEPTVLAATLGAKVLERHVTLDHKMWGTDQASSLEPTGMDGLMRRTKMINSILGNGRKRVTDSEKEVRKKLRGI